jgi:quercetin dioxygenase-like cupin family protein
MQHYRWDDMPAEQVNDWMQRRLVTGDRTMVAQIFMKKGGVVPMHRHENEQITWVVEGALKFQIEGRELVVRAGELLHIPSNVPHAAIVMEDTIDIDIFTPPRQDWLEGSDEYLRKAPPAQVAPEASE